MLTDISYTSGGLIIWVTVEPVCCVLETKKDYISMVLQLKNKEKIKKEQCSTFNW